MCENRTSIIPVHLTFFRCSIIENSYWCPNVWLKIIVAWSLNNCPSIIVHLYIKGAIGEPGSEPCPTINRNTWLAKIDRFVLADKSDALYQSLKQIVIAGAHEGMISSNSREEMLKQYIGYKAAICEKRIIIERNIYVGRSTSDVMKKKNSQL